MIKRILSVETSCDDTSVAIVEEAGKVIVQTSFTKDIDHARFGGIVPEIASRNHTFALLPLIDEALKKSNLDWKDIDGFAVTNRPGLIGALIVGLVTVKTLAMIHKKPFIGVNHLEGHLLAPFLNDENYFPSFSYQQPYIALAVSGGHTTLYLVEAIGRYKVLGATQDDAAGEAFDKFGKMVGFGFPGGVQVDLHAKEGDRQSYNFPRSMIHDESLNMSFSGLKSSAHRLVNELGPEQVKAHLYDLCASYQEAIVDVLVTKLEKACQIYKVKNVVVTGGVSANSRLRERVTELAKKRNWTLAIPPLRYCTDNAAMIGLAGLLRLQKGEQSPLDLGPSPSNLDGDFF
ncbi:MAG: tRNA (adenosine(37)-N6)-threonylcarbamoyltransferase complex transferase subunit TsaD [Bdellovibrionales bacterium]